MTKTESTVAIMQAMGFTACFVAACAVLCVGILTVAIQRSIRHKNMLDHQETLEKLRLSNTKEIAVRPND